MSRFYPSFLALLIFWWCSTGTAGAQCTITASVGPSSTFCPGADTITASPHIIGSTYQWQQSTTSTGPWTNIAGATSGFYFPMTTGYYRVAVTNSSCQPLFYSNAVSVTILPAPAAVITPAGPVSICQGTNLSLCTAPCGGCTYAWLVNGTPLPGSFSNCVAATISGTYAVQVTGSNTCMAISNPVTVTVNNPPAMPNASNITYCQNATAVPLTALGINLLWYTTAVGGTGMPSVTPPTSTPGSVTYYVSQTVNGCEGPRAPVTVTVIPPPSATASSNSPVCVGDTIILTGSSNYSPVSFLWAGPNGFTSTLQHPFLPNAGPLYSGTYQLVVSANGCVSPAASVLVTVGCPADSVWAGDANSDLIADNLDNLEIALNFGATGPARSGASIAWNPQFCTAWAMPIASNAAVNGKYADCNGDGTVNLSDTLAVYQNYGLIHPKQTPNAHARTTGVPDLYFDFSNVALYPGATVTVPLKLGTTSLPMSNILGIAGKVHISGIPMNAPAAISFNGGWLGAPANTLRFSKAVSSQQVDFTYARTDHQNASGYGTIGQLTLTLPAGVLPGQKLVLGLDEVVMVDNAGTFLTGFNVLYDSATVNPAGIGNSAGFLSEAAVIPNPSGTRCDLQVTLTAAADLTVKVTDLTGRTVWQQSVRGKAGSQRFPLPAAQLPTGMYLVQLLHNGQSASPALKWMRME